MVKKLYEKRILFLTPAFFGYEFLIKEKLENMGAIVDLYDERSVTKSFHKALLKISPVFFRKKTELYYNKIIEENKNKTYDYVLIIKCDMLNKKILEKMKVVFFKAKFCLYLWDSLKNIPEITKKFMCFDHISSFDRLDCEAYTEMKLRPLFYSDNFKKQADQNVVYKYDINFCGTVHSNRFKIIKEISDYCSETKLSFFLFCYLQNKFMYYFYKVYKKEFRDTKKEFFSFQKMNNEKISKIVDYSKATLDIQHPHQNGLTMRTIEMLGMNKKLITTNGEIKNYDFYNPKNILVINRENIQMIENFLETPYEKVDENIYFKYSLEFWIQEVLFIEEEN